MNTATLEKHQQHALSTLLDIIRPDLDESFTGGVDHLKFADFSTAQDLFESTCNRTDKSHRHYYLYQSFLGLIRVFDHDETGLNICLSASKNASLDSDITHNLACAYYILNKWNHALTILQQGLDHSPKHRSLNLLKRIMKEKRHKPVIPFLNRNHPLNIRLGKIMYRKK